MRRLVAIAACLLACGGALSACALFRGSRVRHVRLDVARVGDDVVFTARDQFGSIVCSLYEVNRPGRPPEVIPGNEPRGPRAVRFIWRARCPQGDDCARSVSYGDARLKSDLAPAPLAPSEPGECYLCGVSGHRRRGEVLFAIATGGEIVDCPGSSRER